MNLPTHPYLLALIGGVIIGCATTIMLLFNGRITGISGILNGLFFNRMPASSWRGSFIAGLVAGGGVLSLQAPATLINELVQPLWLTGLGGFLVGFGTLLGSGCTSGHGVCGISRLSPRSIIATLTFILFGILSVAMIQTLTDLRSL